MERRHRRSSDLPGLNGRQLLSYLSSPGLARKRINHQLLRLFNQFLKLQAKHIHPTADQIPTEVLKLTRLNLARCFDTLRYLNMPTVAHNHVHLDKRGVAWVDDTTTKVVEVALDQIAHGWSAEEIHFQHSHLSLGQIHSALAYYYDHKAEFETEIHASLERVEQLRTEAGESPIRKKLRALGKSTTADSP